jgi:hypothetical protein
VVVAGNRQHAAVFRAARGVGVAEDVAAAIDTRPLAVPHGENAVVSRVAVQRDLLRAPHRGRREIFVQPGLEVDVQGFEKLFRAPELVVDVAQRRAAVAADKAGGVQPGAFVARTLQHRQTHQRLCSVEVDAAAGQLILVIQCDGAQCAVFAVVSVLRRCIHVAVSSMDGSF